jgi:threonylcarbamoyladenosine tRNA methylthiotransferase MtaB
MKRRCRIAVRTVGCRANQADSAALVRGCDEALFEATDQLRCADIVVVNTCCVTQEAERDCRKIVHRAQREAENAVIAVVGCAVNAQPGFATMLGDRVVALPWEKAEPGNFQTWLEEIARSLEGVEASSGDAAHSRAQKRTRALLKVQSGCTHGCAYCIVPRARGEERSMPLDEAVSSAMRLAEEGFREIVLTGVQLGAWGIDLRGRPRLPALLVALADAVAPGRVRLSSIEPWSVDEALLDVVAGHPRICPHLHVPLQSGDDRILGLMGRGYSVSQFEAIALAAKRKIGDLAFGTDILCGFPTETEEEHENTLSAVERFGFTHVHAFPFSPRQGTRAAEMGNAPGREIAKERVLAVRALGDGAVRRFVESQRGGVREAIVEEARGGKIRGLCDNFIPVEISGGRPGVGSLVDVEIGECIGGGVASAIGWWEVTPR